MQRRKPSQNLTTFPGTRVAFKPRPAPPPEPTNTQVIPRPQEVAVPPPAAPVGLTARALSPTQVQLSWTLPDNYATRIFVERNASPPVTPFNTIDALAAGSTSYTATVESGSTYYFAIAAESFAGLANSDPVNVTTPVAGNPVPVMWLKANSDITDAMSTVTTGSLGPATYTDDAKIPPTDILSGGQAFDFFSQVWFLSIVDQAPLELSSFTVALWRKRFQSIRVHGGNGIGQLFAWGAGGFNMYETDSQVGVDGAVRFGISAGAGPGIDYGESSLTLPTSDWAHVAVALDANSRLAWVWINGQPDPQNPFPIPATSLFFGNDLGIPCLDGLDTYRLYGYIDDVRFFSGVLTDVEVSAVYAEGGA